MRKCEFCSKELKRRKYSEAKKAWLKRRFCDHRCASFWVAKTHPQPKIHFKRDNIIYLKLKRKKVTNGELAKQYGVTRQRINQIYHKIGRGVKH